MIEQKYLDLFPLYRNSVKKKFDGWVLGSIDLTYETTKNLGDKATPLVAFLLISCAIDAISGFYKGRISSTSGSISADYKAFIAQYMPSYSPKLFYEGMRCALAHNFNLGTDVVLIYGHPENHKMLVKNVFKTLERDAREIWNFENVLDDFRVGLDSYFRDLEGSNELKENFINRFKKMGVADTLGADNTGSSFS
jgi:hypothetical protein